MGKEGLESVIPISKSREIEQKIEWPTWQEKNNSNVGIESNILKLL